MQGIRIEAKQAKIILIFFLSLISAATFILILWRGYPDIPDHNRYITKWLSGDKEVKLYSLYYPVILILSFFQNNTALINVISVLVLVFSVIFKFLTAVFIFKNECKSEDVFYKKTIKVGPIYFGIEVLILFVVLLVCLAQNFIIKPSATMALGYLPVNTWHNSTTIFLMPFALWLFYRSYIFIENHKEEKNKYWRLGELLLLAVFTVFIKPSYFFAFSIAFPLYFLLRFGITRHLFHAGLVSLFSGLALLLVYRYVFTGGDSSVIIRPFQVWGYWTTNIPMSLLASVFFPLLFLLFYFKEAIRNSLLSYAWVNMLVATAIYILLTETGGRAMHGNFSWQTIICNFILFLTTWILFMKIVFKKERMENKDKIIVASFLLHVIFGLIFLLKLPFYGAR